MNALTEIEALFACEGRWAGTDGELRAAKHLGERLRSLGREAELEPAVVSPDYPLTYVLHILLALAGGALSARRTKLGAAALGLAIVSTLGDSSARFHLLRQLTKRERRLLLMATSADELREEGAAATQSRGRRGR